MARTKTDTTAGTASFKANIQRVLEEFLQRERPNQATNLYEVELRDTKFGQKLLDLDRTAQADLVELIAVHLITSSDDAPWYGLPSHERDHRYRLLLAALRGILNKKLPLSSRALATLLRWIAEKQRDWEFRGFPMSRVAAAAVDFVAEGSIDESLREAIVLAVDRLRRSATVATCRNAAQTLQNAISEGEPVVSLWPGEAWSDAARADLDGMEPGRRHAWLALLASCQSSGTRKPTTKWINAVRPLFEAIGPVDVRGRLACWLPLVDRPRTNPIPPGARVQQSDWDHQIREHHVNLLKGLAWCATLEPHRDLAHALSTLALSAYRKVPGKGPRLPALGNAAIAALGAMPSMDAVGQLALLKVKVKFIPAQKEIEKALGTAADREGLPREEVDELAVPTYGMEEVGRRREVLGDYVAELVVEGSNAVLRWSKVADGKGLKSTPAAAKKGHGEAVKELQAAVKDVGKMLTAQRQRIDGLFLARKRWPLDVWRERYLDHPLVGTIARRLLWRFETDGRVADGIWLDGQLVGVDDRPIGGLGSGSTVELWHPIGRSVDEITAWRDRLDRRQVRQPFKQAHREVYVLTDAERATGVYSNRFAAHVLRQHQYNALCAVRDWRNSLRLIVDSEYPPSTRSLPEWGLRAEFWVEGIGDDYGRDTTESGSYLHLATDQVRFYELDAAQRHAHAGGGGYAPGRNRADAEPLPIDRVPPLVLSEILRDVDLFVGVASVGNDPNWADGGPDGRHVDYWRHYSFGDLSANGQTRKAVLERLIPRLKIAPRCTFSDKFLIVRGDLRTYKVHLGSGNILMEPNDQYLCIVAKRGAADSDAPRRPVPPVRGERDPLDHPQQGPPAGRRHQNHRPDHRQSVEAVTCRFAPETFRNLWSRKDHTANRAGETITRWNASKRLPSPAPAGIHRIIMATGAAIRTGGCRRGRVRRGSGR